MSKQTTEHTNFCGAYIEYDPDKIGCRLAKGHEGAHTGFDLEFCNVGNPKDYYWVCQLPKGHQGKHAWEQ